MISHKIREEMAVWMKNKELNNCEDHIEKSLRSSVTTKDAGIILSTDASDFGIINDKVPDALLEIRYYSTCNFVGESIDGYEEPFALMTREAAKALKAVSDELFAKGYRLKIYEAYRPQNAVNHFVRWSEDTGDTHMKAYFYPELKKICTFTGTTKKEVRNR